MRETSDPVSYLKSQIADIRSIMVESGASIVAERGPGGTPQPLGLRCASCDPRCESPVLALVASTR